MNRANSILKEVGKTIQSARTQGHLTQEQLAQKCGISVSELYGIEQGTADPRMSDLCKIAEVLDLTVKCPLVSIPDWDAFALRHFVPDFTTDPIPPGRPDYCKYTDESEEFLEDRCEDCDYYLDCFEKAFHNL